MKDADYVQFLQWALPQLQMRWPGFRKVRRQVIKRINRRIVYLQLADISAYRDYLDSNSCEWLVLDEMCRITISRFYRDRRVFDLIRDAVLPQLAEAAHTRGDNAVRSWNAGCASGEETYTLKMIWEIGLRGQFPNISLQIVTTDADPQMLQRARRGCYPSSSVKELPKDWITAAFKKSGTELQVRDQFRTRIEFLPQDIRRQQPDGPFDLIFCRHLVFTYFDTPLQKRILQQMLTRLRPRGILVIGKQESLPDSTEDRLELIWPQSGIYRCTRPQ